MSSFDDVSSSLPRHIVQAQLDAYNARDIDSFMHAGGRMTSPILRISLQNCLRRSSGGKSAERHIVRFREPNLFGRLLNRIVAGDLVIDHESVVRTFPEGAGEVDVVAIYQVKDGKIVNAWFRMGPNRILGPTVWQFRRGGARATPVAGRGA